MRAWSKLIVLAAAGSVTAMVTGTTVKAADITVVTSGGPLPSVMGTIIPMFERATGHKVTISTKPGSAIAADVRQGAVDLVVTDAAVVDELGKSGDISDSSKTLLMISKIGLAVKAGAPSLTSAAPTS